LRLPIASKIQHAKFVARFGVGLYDAPFALFLTPENTNSSLLSVAQGASLRRNESLEDTRVPGATVERWGSHVRLRVAMKVIQPVTFLASA
jgi:hypothetical protein